MTSSSTIVASRARTEYIAQLGTVNCTAGISNGGISIGGISIGGITIAGISIGGISDVDASGGADASGGGEDAAGGDSVVKAPTALQAL